MFIPLLPLLTIAASLQESVFNYFNYNNAADLASWTSRLRTEGQVEPLFLSFVNDVWMSLQLENAPLSSYFNPAFVTALGSGDPVGYGSCLSLSDGGLAPTRPSSAVAPIRGFANRPFTSATSPFPLPTRLATTTRPSGPAPDSTGEPHNPWATQDASLVSSSSLPTSTSLPIAAPSSGPEFLSHPLAITYGEPDASVATSTPMPVVSSAVHPTPPPAAGAPADRPSLASRYVWTLLWMLPIAIHLGIGAGIYLAQRRLTQYRCQDPEAGLPDILKILRLHEELKGLPHIIHLYDISPGELQSYIELAVRTRRSLYGNPTAEPEVMRAQDPVAPPSVSRTPSAGPSPVPGPSNARTPDTPNPPSGLAAMSEDLASAVARFDRLFAEVQTREARIDLAMRRLSEDIDCAPGSEELSLESNAPVASSSDERHKAETRARTSGDTLGHKVTKRTSRMVMGGELPTPEPSRGRSQSRVPRAGDAAGDVGGAWFLPNQDLVSDKPAPTWLFGEEPDEQTGV
ncbi:hypothetical protein FRC06_004667 [Ceratobasidium sp. 370]|nr:hypothetical protein FRC06_004667 [Ceratobasidium sp. 370]